MPGCMASSHSVVSVSDVRFTLGYVFTVSSDPISAILVLFLGGLGLQNFGDGFFGCCIVCGHLAWVITVDQLLKFVPGVAGVPYHSLSMTGHHHPYHSLSMTGHHQFSFAWSMQGGGSRSALLGQSCHPAASAAPLAPG